MDAEIKKEERNEYVSIYVTKSLKQEFELAKDNQTLKETIIRNYLSSERDWLNEELKQIDESTVKYSAKLIGIKDKFQEANSSYVEEVENIYKNANETFRKLDTITVKTQKNIEYTKDRLSDVLKKINDIDFSKLDRLINTIDKFNSMNKEELDLLKKLLSI
jgi:hypothetical protein